MSFDIIERLNGIRKGRKISVYRLSELTGISQSTLANTFSRGMVPSIENLDKICKALDISLSDFFREDDSTSKFGADEQRIQHEYSMLSDLHKKSVNHLIDLMYKESVH